MSRSNLNVIKNEDFYFITTTVHNRIPILNKTPFVEIIIDTLSFLIKRNEIQIFGYVIMPDHIHIISKAPDTVSTIKKFKSYTGSQILSILKKKSPNLLQRFKSSNLNRAKYQFWERSFHPVWIFNEGVFIQKLEYIHRNPVKANLVQKETDYEFSSASFYELGYDKFTICSNPSSIEYP